MGEALLVRILKSGISATDIGISVKRDRRIVELKRKYGCQVVSMSDIASLAKNILLVVKPQDLDS
jgi:pyrroline-5-carboxylate reductase